jgi:fumarate hydratase subunit alpha
MMKRADVVAATIQVLKEAETTLPPWVVRLIEDAANSENNPVAKSHLQFILENIKIAGSSSLPMCQDTGLLVFHIEKGIHAECDFDINEAIADGVRVATKAIPLRPNVVDPLSRKNTGDNTGDLIPYIITDTVEGNSLRITAFPKGAGSENMSLVGMLNPADDPLDFIVECVAARAANACPPLFLGIGIGGTFDLAASLAKRALFNLPGSSEIETDLLRRINSLGIGPMGLGGDTTALGVKIERASCHTASLPVAINFQCWAHRCASIVLR